MAQASAGTKAAPRPATSKSSGAQQVRWYRRRPQAELGAFARNVWWTGHGQLFIALANLVMGVVGVAGIAVTSAFAGHLASQDWSIYAAMGFPFAFAFLLSGAALRSVASVVEARSSLFTRWTTTLGMVLLIAFPTILLVAMGIGGIFLLWYQLGGQGA